MTKKLEGKIAVITGATSGLALATAKLFASEGAFVYITGRRRENLDAAVKEIGANARGVQGDSANLKDLDKLFEVVRTEKGRIDILYASAGAAGFMPFGAITEKHFDDLFDLNVRGTLFTIQKALPLMSDGSSIIMTGSIAGVKGLENMGVYNASKAALRSSARTLTADLKSRKIRTNVISPGPIDTAAVANVPEEFKARMISTVPLGRMGRPEEIAKAALFLASDDSSFVTGIELFVDGGAAQI